MCYDEGTLQAYTDRELSGKRRWEMEAHIEKCVMCKLRLEELRESGELALTSISSLSGELSDKQIITEAAWQRLIQDGRFGMPARKRGVFDMLNKKTKMALMSLAASAVIAMAVSFTPIGEAAAGFLNIFRVDKIETIEVSADDIRKLSRLASPDGGSVNIQNLGKIETSGYRPPFTTTLKGSNEAIDFGLKLPDMVDGFGAPFFQVQPGFTTSFTLDVAKANALIKSFGAGGLLPDSLDGRKFSANMPTVVTANYPRDNGGTLMVAQARSPEFVLPEGVDADMVRDVLLGLPMLPDNIKSQLEAIKDWKHTLPVPNINGSSEKVKVNGVEGVFIRPPKDARGESSALIWQKDGVIYAISGQIDIATAQRLADSMK